MAPGRGAAEMHASEHRKGVPGSPGLGTTQIPIEHGYRTPKLKPTHEDADPANMDAFQEP